MRLLRFVFAGAALLGFVANHGVCEAARAERQSGILSATLAVKRFAPSARKGETTAAREARAIRELKGLLAGAPKLKQADGGYWKLLGYLRQFPADQMPAGARAWYFAHQPNPAMTPDQRAAFVESFVKTPAWQWTPKQVDAYLPVVHEKYPKLRDRVVHLARLRVGQPYEMYLLGEFPYEVYDDDPLYCLDHGDCVVFSEHTYAMALGRNWKEFFGNLQRLRYRNGEIGMTTRNHYTEADWDKNNAWLLEDVTEKLGATTVTQYTEKIDRAEFFKRFGIGQDAKVEMFRDTYIPASAVESSLAGLKDGDFVNVVRGSGGSAFVGHVGLIGHKPDGTVTFIHSTPPKSKEQPIMEYLQESLKKNPEKAKKGSPQFLGFKFLRLRDADLEKELQSKPVKY